MKHRLSFLVVVLLFCLSLMGTGSASAQSLAAAPVISSVTATNADGVYGVGSKINLVVNFSEPVIASGNVNIVLNSSGALACQLTIPNASASVGCVYTVKAGDTSSDLNIASISGSIVDTQGTPMADFTPGSALSINKNIIIRTTGTSVVSITSPIARGTYDVGAKIPLFVTFSAPVYKLGSFNLNLNTTPAAPCVVNASSPTTTLSCIYIVRSGDTTNGASLNVTSFNLNSPILDLAGNTVTNTIAANSLASSSAIIIDANHTAVVDSNFCSLMATAFDPLSLSTGDISSIQRFFVSQGYNGLLNQNIQNTGSMTTSYDVSGIYDTATKQALGGFQLLSGLTLNGTFDQYTRALIAKLSNCDGNAVVDIRNGNDFAQIILPGKQVKWKAGTTYSIKYKIQKQTSPRAIFSLVQVLDSTAATGTRPISGVLKSFIGANGTYTTTVTVPTYLPKGIYRLTMSVARTNSDRFAVTAKGLVEVKGKASGNLPTIDITGPQEGAAWNKQADQLVTWDYDGRAAVRVWVTLHNVATRASYRLSTLAGVPNSNGFFKVAKAKLADVPPGIYYVTVQQTVTSNIIPYLPKGASPYFNIVDGNFQPALTSVVGESGTALTAVNRLVKLSGSNFSALSNDINFSYIATSSTGATSTVTITRGLTGIGGTASDAMNTTASVVSFLLPPRVCSLGNPSQCIDFINSTYKVSVTTANGTSNSVSFNVAVGQSTSTSPLVSAISPDSATIGSLVRVYGVAFAPSGNVIWLNGRVLTSTTSPDGVSLKFVLPSTYSAGGALAFGTYTLVATNSGGVSNNVAFNVVSGATTIVPDTTVLTSIPNILSITPSAGGTGSNVQIVGTGFTATENTVTFGSGAILHLPATLMAGSSNTSVISFNVPSVLVPECLTLNTCSLNAQTTTPGARAVSVKNANGMSGSVTFNVN